MKRAIWLILAVVSAVYGVSILAVGSGTLSFAIWLAAAAVFLAAFWFSGGGRWQRLPMAQRRAVLICVILGTSVCGVCMGAELSHFNDRGPANLDFVIVPGAQVYASGPSLVYRFRLDAAAEYLKENPDTICIVSGGQGANETATEGEAGREYLVARGIEPERVLAETKAFNTAENIRYSMEIAEASIENGAVTTDESISAGGSAAGESTPADLKIGVVTNNFHVFRCVYLADKLTDCEVHGIAAPALPWFLPNNMVREVFGILRDLV